MRRKTKLLIGIAITAFPAARPAAQEPDSTPELILQAPGPRYGAGGLHRLLLGREYRSLWTTPVPVPLLDLRTFAGGLTAVSKGGGQQTKSLLLRGRDGREFFFRSVDKDPSGTLPPELRPTVAGDVVRDQTSSALPTAPLIVGPLLTAAGILHPESGLYVLPQSPLLREFQGEFAGLMGFLEERVGGGEGPSSRWGGAAEIIGSDTLLARINRTAADRVDVRAFLTARLFDLLIGDWDRHAGQWRWARFGDAIPHRWAPIPQDRDQAFAKYDGILLAIGRQSAPQLTNFGARYPYIAGATWNGRDLDRRLLTELEWPDWESVATALQGALTDEVIGNAVRALPPEHYSLKGAPIAAALRTRRDRLLEASRDYYDLLAKEVDVHGSEATDRASFVRQGDGTIELTLSRAGASSSSGTPDFHRRFDPRSTKEVRLFLGPGDDTATVRGRGAGPLIRIIGGEGEDQLVDSSRGGGERFYDEPDAPEKTAGLATGIDRRPYLAPRKDPESLPPRDWGKRWTASTWGTMGPDLGLLVGVGRTLTVYGFRKDPFASRHRFRAGLATGPMSYRLDYRGEFRRENSTGYFDIVARASGIDVITFHGFGNELAAPGNNEFYRVTQDAFGLLPSWVFPLGPRATLQIGGILKYVSTDSRPDRFLATLGNLYGTGNFGEIGGGVTARFDSRNRVNAATRGGFIEIGGKIYPPVWDLDSTFGEAHIEAATFLTPKIPLQPTLALRVGGRKLWGRYPFFEAAFIGGSTVRLGRVNRYAGDAAAYGNAELRLPLARVTLILPADIGLFGLADAGRVFLNGESSDKWHSAVGGGVWLAYLDRANTISLAVAGGEEHTALYVQAGFGF